MRPPDVHLRALAWRDGDDRRVALLLSRGIALMRGPPLEVVRNTKGDKPFDPSPNAEPIAVGSSNPEPNPIKSENRGTSCSMSTKKTSR